MLKVYDAIAYIQGGNIAPDIHGTVKFLGIADGSWVEAEIFGLPDYQESRNNSPQVGPFGFHIHEFGNCSRVNSDTPFSGAGEHWNPTDDPHGNHAGDFPVLFSNNGTAKMLFFTNRFYPSDVIGKSIIIHQSPDDFTTQPNGSGGMRIACGSIVDSNMRI